MDSPLSLSLNLDTSVGGWIMNHNPNDWREEWLHRSDSPRTLSSSWTKRLRVLWAREWESLSSMLMLFRLQKRENSYNSASPQRERVDVAQEKSSGRNNPKSCLSLLLRTLLLLGLLRVDVVRERSAFQIEKGSQLWMKSTIDLSFSYPSNRSARRYTI